MTLYRIDDYAATPVVTDITPAGEPDYPYALAADALNALSVVMVTDNQHWYSSVDSGDTWTDEGETSVVYRGIKRAGDYLVLFGQAIKFSEDGGATASDKDGDWNDSLGSLGSIRGLWIAL